MEEPLAMQGEPDDEAQRLALPPGAFSGVVVEESRASMAELLGEPDGLRVQRLVENSPGEAAGLEVGDLLLEVGLAGAGEGAAAGAADWLGGGDRLPLRWTSDWRRVELGAEPGTTLLLHFERGGREHTTTLTPVPRVRPPARAAVARVREEERVGVVLRQATEVEARQAGLGAGGAVVVGLSDRSPWRHAGVQLGDLVTAVDGRAVAGPDMLVLAIRGTAPGDELTLELLRGGEPHVVRAAVSQREAELSELTLPLVFSYEKERDRRSWSFLLGLLGYESTAAAWELQLLWFFSVGCSDADVLQEVDR